MDFIRYKHDEAEKTHAHSPGGAAHCRARFHALAKQTSAASTEPHFRRIINKTMYFGRSTEALEPYCLIMFVATG